MFSNSLFVLSLLHLGFFFVSRKTTEANETKKDSNLIAQVTRFSAPSLSFLFLAIASGAYFCPPTFLGTPSRSRCVCSAQPFEFGVGIEIVVSLDHDRAQGWWCTLADPPFGEKIHESMCVWGRTLRHTGQRRPKTIGPCIKLHTANCINQLAVDKEELTPLHVFFFTKLVFFFSQSVVLQNWEVVCLRTIS